MVVDDAMSACYWQLRGVACYPEVGLDIQDCAQVAHCALIIPWLLLKTSHVITRPVMHAVLVEHIYSQRASAFDACLSIAMQLSDLEAASLGPAIHMQGTVAGVCVGEGAGGDLHHQRSRRAQASCTAGGADRGKRAASSAQADGNMTCCTARQ